MACREVVKEEVELPGSKGQLAFLLHNVLSPEECQQYIKHTEKKGYELALVNIGAGRQAKMTDVRNSSRYIWDSPAEADKIWQRIKPFIPEVFGHRKALGLNERLRFLRYDPGEYFKPHYDGTYRRDNGEQSYITVQLYLNQGFEGGSTTFFPHNYFPYDGEDEEIIKQKGKEVVPQTGMALIFEHHILHEGSTLKSGRKYAVRTDVMFSSTTV